MSFDKKLFPTCFPKHVPPERAKCQNIEEKVYRVCKWGKVEPKAFLPTYIETVLELRPIGREGEENEESYYAMSVYGGNLKRLKKMKDNFMRWYPEVKLACGSVLGEYGPSFYEKRMNTKVFHVDWWLYKKRLPYEKFKVEDDELLL